MGAEVHWLNENKTLIQHNYFGRVSHEDLRKAIEMTAVMLADIGHQADVIINIVQGSIPPARMLTLAPLVEARECSNMRLMVVVHPTAMIQSVVLMARKTYPRIANRVYFADDIFEARGLIAYYNSLI